jgi:preprotein translocase subunit SecG
VESFLVANDLDGDNATVSMIHTSHDLPERSLSKYVNDLVPIGEVVTKHNIVIASLVVIPVVAGLVFVAALLRRNRSDDLARIFGAGEIHAFFVVVHDFSTLEDVQGTVAVMQHLLGTHRAASNGAFLQGLGFAGSLVDVAPFLTQSAHLFIGGHVVLVFDDGRNGVRG